MRKLQPKYSAVWDISVVLKYLSELSPNELLSLKNLTLKVLMLLLLVSSQGGQTMHKLDPKYMTVDEDQFILQIPKHMKTLIFKI